MAKYSHRRSAVSTDTSSATTMPLPSDREILIERVFDAPRRLVFDA